MSSEKLSITKEMLNRFFPLNLIEEQFHDQLKQNAFISTVKAGDVITKKTSNDDTLHHYLISGAIEVRLSFDNRFQFQSDDERCQFPLEDNIEQKGTIRAIEDATLLVINIEIIDQLKAWSQSYDYEIVHLHNVSDINNDTLIDDSNDDDWSNLFIQSPLASNLSVSDLHKLFTRLEIREVKKGEEIVQRNTDGDYFYIIQSGNAEVKTDPHGAYKGRSFELGLGDYFGDEALVADSMRNASVVMSSDGTLGILDREAFSIIVKEAVVKTKNESSIEGLLADQHHYIDVRLPIEFRSEHHGKSENIPISHLRKQLEGFDYSKVYFITPEGGRRSELATYLLRQAGFEAYCMVGT